MHLIVSPILSAGESTTAPYRCFDLRQMAHASQNSSLLILSSAGKVQLHQVSVLVCCQVLHHHFLSLCHSNAQGEGIAIVVCDQLLPHTTFTNSFPFNHISFELAQLSMRSDQSRQHFIPLLAATNQNQPKDPLFIEVSLSMPQLERIVSNC